MAPADDSRRPQTLNQRIRLRDMASCGNEKIEALFQR
jgi:hypothetical protein